MPSATIVLLLESSFLLTAKGIMIILRILETLTSHRIRIGSAILLSTGPTPSSAAAQTNMKFITMIKAT
jgi:hypothetical protein